ncbi:phosphatidylserine decarboxylase-domain-containing protein [Dichomitus squalens]|uniref:Phosphatidylserine decarboxylase-domain-containing protein n=1 Tax=Dichomitus squalens TaxID=114155 RepID=A0A4Q9Q0Q4_9APHY|nr:phosphatidylserine decarboxylase-domain-containing protein [Dichomitus squalens]TBU60713.1 phosphatidylserine decarboxylase-domain-containing protein [Dichomitus squalens]
MSYVPTTSIVQKLVAYFTKNPDFKTAFEQSFLLAHATGLKEFDTFNIHSVDDYIRFMDEFVHWKPTEDYSGKNVYYHICMFYFVLDLPPVRDHQSPIDPASRSPWRWLSDWLIEYAQEMGLWMDKPESIDEETIQTFANSPAYRDTPETDFFDQYPRPPNGWKNFNDFFARHINPTFRPIADREDPTAIVCPADCSFDGQWPINEDTADVTTFDVKGVPWSISQLLDDEASGTYYGHAFAGGVFTHSFLNTTDYHRQHAPVSGRVLEAKVIPGLCYLEVVLKEADSKTPGGRPHLGMHRQIRPKKDDSRVVSHQEAIRRNAHRSQKVSAELVPDAPDSPGYQFIQARGLILIESDIGLVAVLPIGMAQVSSVVLSVKKGDYVEKGQEISCFHLGGSDIVMVFQKEAKVVLNQEMNTHYKFGSRIGTGQPVPKQTAA